MCVVWLDVVIAIMGSRNMIFFLLSIIKNCPLNQRVFLLLLSTNVVDICLNIKTLDKYLNLILTSDDQWFGIPGR